MSIKVLQRRIQFFINGLFEFEKCKVEQIKKDAEANLKDVEIIFEI